MQLQLQVHSGEQREPRSPGMARGEDLSPPSEFLQEKGPRSLGRGGASMRGIKQVQNSQLYSPLQEEHPEPGTRFMELQWGKATFPHQVSREH